MNWTKAKTIITKNKEVQNELKKNESEYKIIEAIIMTRKEKNLKQKDLAELTGLDNYSSIYLSSRQRSAGWFVEITNTGDT